MVRDIDEPWKELLLTVQQQRGASVGLFKSMVERVTGYLGKCFQSKRHISSDPSSTCCIAEDMQQHREWISHFRAIHVSR